MGDTFREDLFRLEVNTGSGGYGFTDTLSELMEVLKTNMEMK